MSTVTVRLFAGAAAAAGYKSIELQATSAGDACDQLRAQLGPAFGRALDASALLVDGVAAHGNLSKTEVLDGTTIDVLPPFAGG
jgi:molybdopterin synthase sulfur carrier subunit